MNSPLTWDKAVECGASRKFFPDDVLSALQGLKEELNIIAPFPMLPNEKKMLDRCNYIIDKWFPILNEAELHEHEDKSSLLLSQNLQSKVVNQSGDAGELSSGVPTAQDVKHAQQTPSVCEHEIGQVQSNGKPNFIAPGNGKKGVRE